MRGYEKGEDEVWRKEGSEHEIPDDRIEEDHFRVLVETMVGETYRARVGRLLQKTGRIPT